MEKLKRLSESLKIPILDNLESYELGLEEIPNPFNTLKDKTYMTHSVSSVDGKFAFSSIEDLNGNCMFLIVTNCDNGSYSVYDENTFKLI